MTKDTINEKLDNLKIQLKQVESSYMRVQGAIEFCEVLIEELEEDKPSNNGKIKEKDKVTV